MAVGRIGVRPEKDGGGAVVERKKISSEGVEGDAIIEMKLNIGKIENRRGDVDGTEVPNEIGDSRGIHNTEKKKMKLYHER